MVLDSNVLPNIFVFHGVQRLPLSFPFPLVLSVLPGPSSDPQCYFSGLECYWAPHRAVGQFQLGALGVAALGTGLNLAGLQMPAFH